MGSCLSKKSTNSSCAATAAVEKPPPEQTKSNAQVVVEKKKVVEEETVKKEIFIIKHRKSHEIDRKSVDEEKCEVKKGAEVSEMAKNGSANNAMNNVGVLGLGPGSGVLAAAPVRTSSCTKEEVDAILIQCGRLSRSSSTGKAALSGSLGSGENGNGVQKGRKYSGSKRSYDFDHENGRGGEIDHCCEDNPVDDGNGVGVLVVGERSNRHRQRQRQSRSVGSPSSKGRRRTPSREREQAQQQQQQRSGSRERVSNGSGRRVSRSPGRRSESPITNSSGVTAAANSSSSSANLNNNSSNNGGSSRPGKMVSVPATVSSMAMMDKSNNNAGGGTETISASAVKRIQVKRNVGCDAAAVVGSRTAASPRARSPARINARAVSIENQNTNSAQNMQQQQQQPLSLSRSNSTKAEQSPYRRNPLSEIDTNVVIAVPHNASQAPVQKLNIDDAVCEKRVKKGIVDKNPQAINNNVAVNVVGSGSEILKPTSSHGVTRSRSSRLSRDLDINPEALSNTAAPSSYTALLLEDIQNFHQKNSNTPAFTLPACVSKACSILEAVADLNSSTGSNFSAAAAAAFSDDKKRIPTTNQFSKLCNDNGSFGAQQAGKGVEKKDPFMQSEVVVVGDDDLMEPSFHKYVTVRRGGTLGGEDMEQQESSGSNSFVSGQQHWTSSSWEPNSADSTDCWTSSSRSNCREDSRSPAVVPFQRFALSELGYYDADEAGRRLSGKKRESDLQQNGIGKGRLGSRGLQSVPAAAAN